MIYETHSPEETYELGKRFGQAAKPGDVFALDGDLGAGKTVWSKGFAAGLDITEPVTSPTFTIVQTYETGRLPLNHLDVYRLADPYELDEIGFEDMIGGQEITLVEWASLFPEIMPEETTYIDIQRVSGHEADTRRITVTGKDILA
ncbi:MAG: tRNA (adenosine(37)-N6)-threonylcarbamoyltransferase complex ATPase subunit type 1 TsaE [Lachnospiraceae bacterium]|nr:tRNA (adenosine(37)-N6)-threonylcarbamoyltransferase complex ATPase subunit type 1 TsaE [Candidatus Equihabitans merdae]